MFSTLESCLIKAVALDVYNEIDLSRTLIPSDGLIVEILYKGISKKITEYIT